MRGWLLLLGCLCCWTSALAGDDAPAAEMLREWLADGTVPATSPSPRLAPWRDYMAANEIPDPAARERALRELHAHADSPYLQSLILRAISEDADFQSRQARFIRRYGYYTNWFNRLLVTTGRALQGNLQAVAQLGVDAANDLFQPGEADQLERRAYKLARTAPAGLDEEQVARLRTRVERALAGADLEHARWALDHGDPEAALFYAGQALVWRPDWRPALQLQHQAATAAAALRRRALASTQLGYPDRPLRLAEATWLRALLAGTPHPAESNAEQRLAADLLASPTERGLVETARRFELALETHDDLPADTRRWLEGWLGSAAHHPDLGLERARARRRGQTLRYIFLGPETPRRQAYKAATWSTHALGALENVGFFYVFEVIGRGVMSVIGPVVPAEQIVEAQAAWLAETDQLQSTEARRLADALADAYRRDARYDQARDVLERAGELTPRARAQLDREEARRYARLARENPAQAEALLARARELDPDVTFKPARSRPEPPRQWRLDWATLSDWSGEPLPSGLSMPMDWFDGRADNAEVTSDGLHMERPRADDADQRLILHWTLLEGGAARPCTARIDEAALPLRLRDWLGLSGDLEEETRAKLERLHRLPIPFEIEGGVGSGGVDFWPQLLPIQSRPGELELYR